MKVTNQLIRSKARQSSLQTIHYLNLSNLDISVLERLNSCSRLQALDISHNSIESVTTSIERCTQLWSFNINNNKVKCLDGFGRFVAIGSLDLSNNELTWNELAKLQHLHILDLRLHGNSLLEKDPYYRIHVIDCLPNIWMLDGRLVTSAERIQVKSFFDDSAVSERPVRHRLTSTRGFVPSALKNREFDGIFGEKIFDYIIQVIHLMRRFPKQDIINVDLDRRRLNYLAENIAQDIILHASAFQSKHQSSPISETFLVELLSARKVDALRCNMFIMLLLTSMEFKVPDSLFMDTMQLMKLDKFGNVDAMEVFSLSQESRALVAGVLISAVKVERVEKQSGGLYDKLYLSMNYLLTECIKSSSGSSSSPNGLYRQYRGLLAAEVVLLMCYVPSFADYIQKEPGVMSLVTTATSDNQVINNVSTLKAELDKQNVSKTDEIKALGQFIQSAVMFNLAKTPEKAPHTKSQSEEQRVFSKHPLPKRPMSGPVFSSTYHMRGKTSPNTNPPRITSAKPQRPRQPEISRQEFRDIVWKLLVDHDVGETVLTSPQCLARVVSLPQQDIALVLLEMIPVNGAMQSKAPSFEEHYAYIDTRELIWDTAKSYWRPRGTFGNRVTLRYVKKEVLGNEANSPTEHSEVTICHHSIGGKVTPITVPQPTGEECELEGLVVDINLAQDRLSVSPRIPSSVPTPSPAQSPPQSRQRSSRTTEEIELHKLSLGDEADTIINNNNNNATEPEVHKIPSSNEGSRPHTTSPVPRTPKQMSIIQIGVTIAPKLTPSCSANDLVKLTAQHSQDEVMETGKNNVVPNEEVTSGRIPLDTSAEFTVDDGDSDEDELSALAREDLIRDHLSTTDLETGITDRHIAPSNSPDMRMSLSRASNQTTSRQPSATINSVYKMLRAEETYKASARHQQVGYGDNTMRTPHLRNRTQEWDLKIYDPDCTPNVSVKWANLWMGGGRDLHTEEMQKRPTSAHVPGWRDGLKGTPRTLSAHTTRYISTGKSGNTKPRKIHTAHAHSTYDQQLSHQQYKFLPQQTSYRRTFLSTRQNMRDKKRVMEVQREVAWTEYVKNAMVHRALQ